MTTQLRNEIFKVSGEDFEQLAIDVFHSQYQHNLLYKSYVNALKINIENINSIARIPFLPISFFKTHDIKTGSFDAEIIFESSGTTQTINSRHYVKNISLYRESFIKGFEKFYGPINDWCIIGLLPSYLERKNSSLIMMVDELIKISNHPQSGFYLYEHDKLNEVFHQLENKKQKALLMGVTF